LAARGLPHSIRLSAAEHKRVRAAAAAAGKSTHAFMREAILDAANARDLPTQLRGVEAAIRAARRAGLALTRGAE
jgi:hypothetical protein